MKHLSIFFPFILSLLLVATYSCSPPAPQYKLYVTSCIPDSLKEEHRKWITETVRAASQHMSGGRYEHPRKTVSAVRYQADELFGERKYGLLLTGNQHQRIIYPDQFTPKEQHLFDSLRHLPSIKPKN